MNSPCSIDFKAVNQATKTSSPLTRDEARDEALDFTAVAAGQEHILFARYSDSPEEVRPRDRAGYDAVQRMVVSERHAATVLCRYALGHIEWSQVESVLNYVGHCHASMRARLDEVLGAGWRDEWIAADIAGLLREVLQAGE